MDSLLLLGALQHVADVLVAQLRRRLAVALDGAVAREAGGRRRRAVAGGAHLVGLELAALELLLDQLLLDEARGVAPPPCRCTDSIDGGMHCGSKGSPQPTITGASTTAIELSFFIEPMRSPSGR